MAYPAWTKSTNPAMWRNAEYRKNKFVAYYRSGMTPYLNIHGLTEADGAGTIDLTRIGKALEMTIAWARSVCKVKNIGSSGSALGEETKTVNADNIVFTFPVFLHDKDRATIIVKVYTDYTHGGSVVCWMDAIKCSNLAEARQVQKMVFRAADFGVAQRKKYTVKSLPDAESL